MAQLPTDPLELAILLHRELQQANIHERHISGAVQPDFNFNAVETSLDNAGLLVSRNASTRTVEFSLPINYFLSLEELISTRERRVTPPSKFFLADLDCLYEGDASRLPAQVQQYLAATQLYEILGRAADHKGGIGSTKTLIFLHKEKIEFVPDYITADLCELLGMAVFKANFIESETHEEQKQTIVRTVLLEMFTGRRSVPFAELLTKFGDLVEKVNASYQLYVSEFSFQKVKAEIEKEKLDATTKLNKVFSDIQNQLLAVPAALILVGGQMENTANWTSKNLSIWLGALVFSVLMSLLVRNQRHTLTAVKQEIDQQWLQIRGKYHSVADRFEDTYRQLDKRYKHQVWLIRIVSFLVAVSLAVATFMLLFFSVPLPLMVKSLTLGTLFAAPFLTWDVLTLAANRYLPERTKQQLRTTRGRTR